MNHQIVAVVAVLSIVAGCTAVSTDTPDNPWGKDPITVSVNDSRAIGNYDYNNIVNRSVDYWETEGEEYRTYPGNLTVEPNSENADIEIRFVDSITLCGMTFNMNGFAGCAPFLNESATYRGTAVVRIDSSMPSSEVESTVKHELGHVFGLNHSSPPQDVMSDAVTICRGTAC